MDAFRDFFFFFVGLFVIFIFIIFISSDVLELEWGKSNQVNNDLMFSIQDVLCWWCFCVLNVCDVALDSQICFKNVKGKCIWIHKFMNEQTLFYFFSPNLALNMWISPEWLCFTDMKKTHKPFYFRIITHLIKHYVWKYYLSWFRTQGPCKFAFSLIKYQILDVGVTTINLLFSQTKTWNPQTRSATLWKCSHP